MSDALQMIADERDRQVAQEGWSNQHDDRYDNDELVRAAVCYATGQTAIGEESVWPWDAMWWKPSPANRLRDLAKAGALIVAEMERIQRAQR